MSIVALGAWTRVAGFRLAGADAIGAEEPEAVLAAWRGLPDDVELLILTPAAADVVTSQLSQRPRLLWVVLP